MIKSIIKILKGEKQNYQNNNSSKKWLKNYNLKNIQKLIVKQNKKLILKMMRICQI